MLDKQVVSYKRIFAELYINIDFILDEVSLVINVGRLLHPMFNQKLLLVGCSPILYCSQMCLLVVRAWPVVILFSNTSISS